MVIQVRKTSAKIERVQRPKEQQDALAGGELPSPDFIPAPTQEESMDMFRRQRQADIEQSGGRTPQSESAPMTKREQEFAVLRAHIKTMRDMGYDDETIKANIPARVLKKMDDLGKDIEESDLPLKEREQMLLDLRDERQRLMDRLFEPPSSISPEDRREGRRPSSEEQSSIGRMRQAEFEAGKPRLDSIYYPSGHPKAGELTPHGAQMYGEIQAGALDLTGMEDVRKNQAEQRRKYRQYRLDVLKAPTE